MISWLLLLLLLLNYGKANCDMGDGNVDELGLGIGHASVLEHQSMQSLTAERLQLRWWFVLLESVCFWLPARLLIV
ncbi:hypothetical protein ACLKA7_012324 [Drosophila subpalustris]